MKTRTDLLNHLAEKYNLQRYLEIGVQNPAQNFDKIRCKEKISIDPDPRSRATFCLTSDAFFELYKKGTVVPVLTDRLNYLDEDANLFEVLGPPGEPPKYGQVEFGDTFDLIFIDGLHTAEQVKKDFENSLKVLAPNGFIVLHDCNPEKEEHTIVPRPKPTGHWNGDVYKFAIGLNDIKWCVDIDNGCMVIPHQRQIEWVGPDYGCDNWEFFDKNRKPLLNLITWDEFVKL